MPINGACYLPPQELDEWYKQYAIDYYKKEALKKNTKEHKRERYRQICFMKKYREELTDPVLVEVTCTFPDLALDDDGEFCIQYLGMKKIVKLSNQRYEKYKRDLKKYDGCCWLENDDQAAVFDGRSLPLYFYVLVILREIKKL